MYIAILLSVYVLMDCLFVQVLLSFQLHRGMVVLGKSVNAERIAANLCCTQLKLDAEDMRKLKELDRGFRYVKVSFLLSLSNNVTMIIRRGQLSFKRNMAI